MIKSRGSETLGLGLCLGLLVGCSEYNIEAIQDSPPVPDEDTGVFFEEETDLPSEDCADLIQPEPYDVDLADDCSTEPQVGSWSPVVEWTWTSNSTLGSYAQVMSTPVAANLTDDNSDGVIDANDIPDVVFTSFEGWGYQDTGALTALSVWPTSTRRL